MTGGRRKSCGISEFLDYIKKEVMAWIKLERILDQTGHQLEHASALQSSWFVPGICTLETNGISQRSYYEIL
jgi:hypothetical protein